MAKTREQYINEKMDNEAVSFNLVDQHTVERLRRDGIIQVPKKKVDIPKDMQWNQKFIASQMLKGIEHGDGVDQMASSIFLEIFSREDVFNLTEKGKSDLIKRCQNSAIRNARTMVTSAENNGRLDSYKDLAAKGVVQKKEWVATPDDRTRPTHVDIDGEEQDIDKVFSNGCMFPGDGKGPAEEVWMCRCTMTDHIIGFRRADGSISKVNYTPDKTLHEEQMEAEKERRIKAEENVNLNEIKKTLLFDDIDFEVLKEAKAAAGFTGSNWEFFEAYRNGDIQSQMLDDALLNKKAEIPVIKERIESSMMQSVMNHDDYQAFMDLVNNADNAELYRDYADKINSLSNKKGGGQFKSVSNSIEFSYETHDGMSRYSTLAHEYNHSFDAKIGKNENLHFTEIDLINERCKIGSGASKPCREWASSSDEFLSALRKDMEALKAKGIPNVINDLKRDETWYNATAGVQDALDGFYDTTKTYYGWGHGSAYYNRMYNDYIKSFGHAADLKDAYNELGINVTSQAQAKEIFRQYRAASEAFANIGSAVTCGGPELEAIAEYMPNTLEAYKAIVGGL